MSRLKHFNYKYYFIYRIINTINKKSYVGFHATNKEYDEDTYFGSGGLLKYAIKKYGANNFVMGIIEYVDPKNWQDKETFWIKAIHSHVSEGGYNQTYGGDGILGHTQSKESNEKRSKAHKGRYINKSYEERYGIEIAERMKANLSKSLSGENHPNWGQHASKETKDKMTNAAKNKPKSEEAKANMSKSCRGKSWEERYGVETANRMKEQRKRKCEML
jgi:group I intron endonuclease